MDLTRDVLCGIGCALSLAVVLGTPLGARAYHLDDSLRGGTAGNALGGSFGPDGWTVTATDDQIWWEIPTTPASGSIEFTVSNVTNASLFPGDNDIFTMYDALGLTEPIRYLPEFGRNNYKIWVRIRTEPEQNGRQKMTVAMCNDGSTSYVEGACPCGTDFVEERTGGDGSWDGSPQRLRIEWGGGFVRFLRNGAVVNEVDYGSAGLEFGPNLLHFTLGSSRSRGGSSVSGMPLGAVFSDVVVDTVDGAVAECGTITMPDAGPYDGGACDPSGNAVADVTAASWEPGVYSVPSDLNVEGDGVEPVGIVYVRFPALTGPVASATLTMHTRATADARGGSGVACAVAPGAWDETTLTWASRPAVTTTCAGTARTLEPSEEMTWDVTSLLAGASGEPTIAIVSSDADGAHYLARETGCPFAPRLDVVYGTPPPDAPEGLDAAGIDAGPVGPSMDAGGRDGGGASSRGLSGCGCRAGSDRGRAPWALGSLALACVLAGRRRR